MAQSERVGVTSGYGARTRQPYVALQIGDRKPYQWSPAEARRVATLLLECAEAAEGDAFLVEWLLDKVGAGLDQAGAVLQEFRAARPRRDGAEAGETGA